MRGAEARELRARARVAHTEEVQHAERVLRTDAQLVTLEAVLVHLIDSNNDGAVDPISTSTVMP
ncbi:MAG TPA: hypothetical protein VIV11_42285 [Kofleriaceae bacterium]